MITQQNKSYKTYMKKNCNLQILCIICTLISNVFAVDNSKFIKPELIDSLLAELAQTTKTNYDKIETLEGKIQFSILNIYEDDNVTTELQRNRVDLPVVPQRLGVIYEGVTNFKSDAKKGNTWSHFYRPNEKKYKNMNTQEIYDINSQMFELTKIVKPDIVIGSKPYLRKMDGTVLENKATKTKRRKEDRVMLGGDHTFFYKPIGFTWDFLLRLRTLHANGRLPDDAVVLKEDGDGYFLTVKPPKTEGTVSLVYHMRLSANAGFNPTLIENFDTSEKTVLHRFILEYTEIKGVFAPHYFHEVEYDENGNMIKECKRTFKDIKVNEHIPESAFTESNLGLKEGDKLIDKTDGNNVKTFILKKENFIDVARPISENDKIASVTGNSDVILEIISTTPKLPAKLKTGNRLEMEVLYELPKNIQDAQIWVLPYTDSGLTPGSTVSHINFVENSSEGTVKSWFYFEQPMFVDEIRVFVGDKKGNIIQTKSVPVSLEWIK